VNLWDGTKLNFTLDSNNAPIQAQLVDGTISSVSHYDPKSFYQLSDTWVNGKQTAGFGYDSQGNLTQVTDLSGQVVLAMKYDSKGNPISSTNESGETTLFTYDSHGMPISKTDPWGQTTDLSWNALGQLTTAKDRLYSFSAQYDGMGNFLGDRLTHLGSGLSAQEVISFNRYPSGMLQTMTSTQSLAGLTQSTTTANFQDGQPARLDSLMWQGYEGSPVNLLTY
jgi:YD repeat-containing protein